MSYKDALRGYRYIVYEEFPGDVEGRTETFVKDIVSRDTQEAAEEILAVLMDTAVNFECYGIRLQPVWK